MQPSILQNGICEDPRTAEQKQLDFHHDELFSGLADPIWEERPQKRFPIRYQNGSSGCVAFACAKILGIDEVYEGREYVELSPRDMYVRRANKPAGGMYLPNALSLTCEGITLESLVPSDGRGESAMNSTENITEETRKIGLKYKTKGYVELPIDIDKIASITSMGKGVLLGFRFDRDQWTSYPFVKPNSTKEVGHGVAGVDNILEKGVKHLIIDDSWGLDYADKGQRHITKEFLKANCFYAGYTLNFTYEPEVTPKPKYTFKSSMQYGDKNKDVVALQNILKYEGVFPLETDSTGKFLGTTKRGVIKLQEKYASEILTPVGLTKGTGKVMASTLKFLNKRYG